MPVLFSTPTTTDTHLPISYPSITNLFAMSSPNAILLQKRRDAVASKHSLCRPGTLRADLASELNALDLALHFDASLHEPDYPMVVRQLRPTLVEDFPRLLQDSKGTPGHFQRKSLAIRLRRCEAEYFLAPRGSALKADLDSELHCLHMLEATAVTQRERWLRIPATSESGETMEYKLPAPSEAPTAEYFSPQRKRKRSAFDLARDASHAKERIVNENRRLSTLINLDALLN